MNFIQNFREVPNPSVNWSPPGGNPTGHYYQPPRPGIQDIFRMLALLTQLFQSISRLQDGWGNLGDGNLRDPQPYPRFDPNPHDEFFPS